MVFSNRMQGLQPEVTLFGRIIGVNDSNWRRVGVLAAGVPRFDGEAVVCLPAWEACRQYAAPLPGRDVIQFAVATKKEMRVVAEGPITGWVVAESRRIGKLIG